jgi:hypothetical protein
MHSCPLKRRYPHPTAQTTALQGYLYLPGAITSDHVKHYRLRAMVAMTMTVTMTTILMLMMMLTMMLVV